MAEQLTFQFEDGGSIPTSPLQLHINHITKNEARTFYGKWHYLGDRDFLSTYNYGAFFNGELVGAISFGVLSAHSMKGFYTQNTQNGWWELKRLAMQDKCPKNSESRFIAVSIRLLKKIKNIIGIVTYADDGVGHTGIIYKATGFTYMGLTAPKTDYMVGEVNWGAKRNWSKRPLNGQWVKRSRKHRFIKRFDQ